MYKLVSNSTSDKTLTIPIIRIRIKMKKGAGIQSDLKAKQARTKTNRDHLETHFQELYRTQSQVQLRRWFATHPMTNFHEKLFIYTINLS